MSEQIQKIKRLIEPVFKRYGIKRAGVFGSIAKGTAGAGSDIDILVDMDLSYDFLDFLKFRRELEDQLQQKVDVVEYRAIKPSVKQNILNSEVVIYES